MGVVLLIRVPAQGKERTGVLSGFFLKKRNNFCLSQVLNCQLTRGLSFCAEARDGSGRLGRHCLALLPGVQCTAEPRPAAATPGSQQGKCCAEILHPPGIWNVL